MAEEIKEEQGQDANPVLPETLEIAVLPLQNTTLFPDTVVPRDFDVIDVPLPERGPPELIARGGRRGRTQDVGSEA